MARPPLVHHLNHNSHDAISSFLRVFKVSHDVRRIKRRRKACSQDDHGALGLQLNWCEARHSP